MARLTLNRIQQFLLLFETESFWIFLYYISTSFSVSYIFWSNSVSLNHQTTMAAIRFDSTIKNWKIANDKNLNKKKKKCLFDPQEKRPICRRQDVISYNERRNKKSDKRKEIFWKEIKGRAWLLLPTKQQTAILIIIFLFFL